MRTTVTLDDELHDLIRRRAFEEHRSFTNVLNEVVRRGISDPAHTEQRTLGAFAGKIQIADDFDDALDDMEVALREPVIP